MTMRLVYWGQVAAATDESMAYITRLPNSEFRDALQSLVATIIGGDEILVQAAAEALGEAISNGGLGIVTATSNEFTVDLDWSLETRDYYTDTYEENYGASAPANVAFSAVVPRVVGGKIDDTLLPDGLPTNGQGFATSAQGAKADTAVQPPELNAALTNLLQGLVPDPLSASGLAPWAALYEADALAIGGLSSWGDTSGNGRDLVVERQVVPNVEAWQGARAVKFASSPMSSLPFVASGFPVTVVLVGDATSGYLFGSGGAQVSRNTTFQMSSTGSSLASSVASSSPVLVIAEFRAAASRIVVNASNVSGVIPLSSTTSGVDLVRLGGFSSSSDYLTGHVAMCGVIVGSITETQISSLRSWAQRKYGIA